MAMNLAQVSVVIGSPQTAPKKPIAVDLWQSEMGAADDRCSYGAYCPRVSVALGDAIDIGESVWRFVVAGPISLLRK
jgi:hypothetical protein